MAALICLKCNSVEPWIEPQGSRFLVTLIDVDEESAHPILQFGDVINKPRKVKFSVAKGELIDNGPYDDWLAQVFGRWNLSFFLPPLSLTPTHTQWHRVSGKDSCSGCPKLSRCDSFTDRIQSSYKAKGKDRKFSLANNGNIQRGTATSILACKRQFDIDAVYVVKKTAWSNRSFDGNPGSVSGVKFRAGQFNLAENKRPLPHASAKQSKCKERNGKGERGIRVCKEFLPPAFLMFGIPAAVFAIGVYIQGRVCATAWKRDARFSFLGSIICIVGMLGICSLMLGDWWSSLICWLW